MSHDDRELMFTPGWRLAEMVAAREVSPVELTEACLRRIDELEPKLHAFLHLAPEYAMDAAREAEAAVMRGDELGPLHGVPIPIKDTEAVAGHAAHHWLAAVQGPYRRRRFAARRTDKGRWRNRGGKDKPA